MKYCTVCGNQIVDEAVICPSCGCAVNTPRNTQFTQTVNQPDEVSVGLCILSFFIPLFGIIYWAVKYKETPKRAKACGITGLISWGVSILVSIISMIFSFSMLNLFLENLLRLI